MDTIPQQFAAVVMKFWSRSKGTGWVAWDSPLPDEKSPRECPFRATRFWPLEWGSCLYRDQRQAPQILP